MTRHQRPHVPELARQDAPTVQPCTIALETVWLTMTGCEVAPGAVDLSGLPDDLRQRLDYYLNTWPYWP